MEAKSRYFWVPLSRPKMKLEGGFTGLSEVTKRTDESHLRLSKLLVYGMSGVRWLTRLHKSPKLDEQRSGEALFSQERQAYLRNCLRWRIKSLYAAIRNFNCQAVICLDASSSSHRTTSCNFSSGPPSFLLSSSNFLERDRGIMDRFWSAPPVSRYVFSPEPDKLDYADSLAELSWLQHSSSLP